MKKLILSILIGAFSMTANADSLAQGTKLQKEVVAEYDKNFSAVPGTLVKFHDFDLLARGEKAMSQEDKKQNADQTAKGIDGGYKTNLNIFDVQQHGKQIHEISLQQWPYSWQSFTVDGKEFTIAPYFDHTLDKNGFAVSTTRDKNKFILFQGNIDYADKHGR